MKVEKRYAEAAKIDKAVKLNGGIAMEKRYAEEDRIAEAVEKAGLLSSTVKIVSKYRKEVAKRDAAIGLLRDEIEDLECEVDSLRAVIGYLKDDKSKAVIDCLNDRVYSLTEKIRAREDWGSHCDSSISTLKRERDSFRTVVDYLKDESHIADFIDKKEEWGIEYEEF